VSTSGTPYGHEMSDYVVVKKIKFTFLFKTYEVDKLGVFVVFISNNNAQYVFFILTIFIFYVHGSVHRINVCLLLTN
jgi:hypothetical protein